MERPFRSSPMPPSPDLRGRIVLVTGASTGIGRATAVELARRGARVGVNYPPFDGERADAEETLRRAEAVATGETAGCLVEADVSNAHDVARMFGEVEAALGPLDALVANAGIQVAAPTHEVEVESFDEVIGVNLRGAFLCMREALRGWLDRDRAGVIVAVSSVHEVIPRPQFASYAASKFGLRGLVRSVALEYADRGVRVNSIAPGATDTPIQSWQDDAGKAAVAEHIPMGRVAEPEEMARVIAYLASDAAPYMTGQTVFVDGGLTLFPDFMEPWSG